MMHDDLNRIRLWTLRQFQDLEGSSHLFESAMCHEGDLLHFADKNDVRILGDGCLVLSGRS